MQSYWTLSWFIRKNIHSLSRTIIIWKFRIADKKYFLCPWGVPHLLIFADKIRWRHTWTDGFILNNCFSWWNVSVFCCFSRKERRNIFSDSLSAFKTYVSSLGALPLLSKKLLKFQLIGLLVMDYCFVTQV